MAALENQKIVFFDGVCNLCNQAVDFLLRYDRTMSLKFAPLQGKTAQSILGNPSLDSIVFYHNGEVLTKARAAFALMKYLHFPWRLFLFLQVLPLAWCDRIYDFIAHNRYRLFGKRGTCRLPSPSEKSRFLD